MKTSEGNRIWDITGMSCPMMGASETLPTIDGLCQDTSGGGGGGA
jgi:hypothetical protein